MEQYYDIVFVVLVYRNFNDLKEFNKSLTNLSNLKYKVLIVDSFFDDNTNIKIKDMCEKYNFDMITVENKGYSFGNNEGIEYVFENYKFSHLIISNPDIEIIDFEYNNLDENVITAPEIFNLRGKKQNPLYFVELRKSEKIMYKALKDNSKFLFYLSLILNKINKFNNRIKIFFSRNKNIRIYAPHGSFIIFPKKIIKNIRPVFDDNMFLFAEENVLATKACKNNLEIRYNKKIKILHKEDGSVGFITKTSEILKKSFIYYYENYKDEKE